MFSQAWTFLVLTSSNTSSSTFYLNQSICPNSAAFLQQKGDYLNIQGGFRNEPTGKELCQQNFSSRIVRLLSPSFRLQTNRYVSVRSEAQTMPVKVDIDRVIAGIFHAFLNLSALTSHLFGALHPQRRSPSFMTNVYASCICINNCREVKLTLHSFDIHAEAAETNLRGLFTRAGHCEKVIFSQ